MMGRAVSIAVVMAGLAAAGAGILPAQEIFWDGFEYGDLCAWSNPPAVYQEQEAFDASGSNDAVNDAELIPTRCAIVEGTIGNPYDPPGPDEPIYDTDFYEFSLEGPALVGIRLERFGALSEFVPYTELSNTSQYSGYPSAFGYFPDAFPALPGDPTTMSRQIYLPENGFVFLDPDDPDFGTKDIPADNKWRLIVDDDRNFFSKSCPCGGQENRYRLTITIESVAGPQGPFPGPEPSIAYPSDGSVLRYRVDGANLIGGSVALVETILDQLAPFATDLDTKLYLVRKNGTTIQTIRGNDDWEYDDLGLVHTDSRIGSTPIAAGPHFVVVDYYARFGTDPVDLGLTIQYLESFWP